MKYFILIWYYGEFEISMREEERIKKRHKEFNSHKRMKRRRKNKLIVTKLSKKWSTPVEVVEFVISSLGLLFL